MEVQGTFSTTPSLIVWEGKVLKIEVSSRILPLEPVELREFIRCPGLYLP